MINHNRIYSGLLATLAMMTALSSGLLLFLTGASAAGGALHTHLPDWALPWVAAINFIYAVTIVIVLCARRFKPESGRNLTRLLNWALLPALPGGTIVGLYGLLTVDKEK
jgi:Mn2+/Fe2+ NRAMP family transporter